MSRYIHFRFYFVVVALQVLFGWAQLSHAEMVDPVLEPIDARLAMPFILAPGANDGFLVQRAEIGQSPDAMGAMIRISPVYGYHPFGKEDGRYSLEHRFAFQLSAQAYFTIKEALAIEAGLSIPFLLYQNTLSSDVVGQAAGDVQATTKFWLKVIPKAKVSLALGLAFDTSRERSFLGGGRNVTAFPRLIVQTPDFFSGRFGVTANLGGVLSDDTTPCKILPTAMGTGVTGGALPIGCRADGKGLGNHLTYGLGLSFLLSPDQGLYLTSEIFGSHSINNMPSREAVVWTIGARHTVANGFYFSMAYGLGLTSDSPAHTAILSIGHTWEETPPPKPKAPPSVTINLNMAQPVDPSSPPQGDTVGPGKPATPGLPKKVGVKVEMGPDGVPSGVVPLPGPAK